MNSAFLDDRGDKLRTGMSFLPVIRPPDEPAEQSGKIIMVFIPMAQIMPNGRINLIVFLIRHFKRTDHAAGFRMVPIQALIQLFPDETADDWEKADFAAKRPEVGQGIINPDGGMVVRLLCHEADRFRNECVGLGQKQIDFLHASNHIPQGTHDRSAEKVPLIQ